ncbi:MAG TPA: LamG domain-containing protein [Kofleriaceae bacterium]
MHRALAPLLAFSACGYPPLASLSDAAPGPDGNDAIASFCDPSDPHLVACYEFEGNAKDGSSHHLDAATSDVTFVNGQVGMAMQFGAMSVASVSDSPVLDITTMTIEAWIRPSQIPSTGVRAGIMDVDPQYSFFFYPGSKMSCATYGGPTVNPGVATSLAADRWSHVACTYDGSATVVYVDGSEVARAAGSGGSPTNGTTGMSIAADNPSNGNRLIGLIDQLRLMNVARTDAEICADAGKPSCP